MPAVSVVVPTHNRAALIGRALDSVLAQTWQDFELLVVDDGSNDGTGEVVEVYRDRRVRLIQLRGHLGAPRARNVGIQAARGEWVAFLDSDDEWLPVKLEAQLARVEDEDPRVAVVYCLRLVRDHQADRTWPVPAPLHEGEVFDALLAGGWTPPTSLVMARRAALTAVGGFDETLPSYQDYDLWLRLAQTGYRFAAVGEVLVVKHRHDGPQITTDHEARARGVQALDAKWGAVVQERLGAGARRAWRQERLAALHAKQLAQVRAAIAGGNRTLAWHVCRTLWQTPGATRWRVGSHAVAIALLGRRVHGLLSRLRRG